MRKDDKLNICLVGCGGMAALYRHRYTQIPGARMYMVIDTDEVSARNAALELHAIRWSTDFNDALSSEVDIIDISTPNYLHGQQAVAALSSGKHVLLQKPIAPTVTEAEEIVEAGRRNNKQVGIYMSMLDNPIYHEIKKVVEKELLGRITSVHCRGAHRGGLSMPEGSWRNSVEKTGGGSFIQLAVHQINMAQFITGDKISRVAAFSKNMMCANIGGDDVTSACCEFEGGIQGVLESAYCADQNILSIYGSGGFISVYNDSIVQIKMDEPYYGEIIRYDHPGGIKFISGLSCIELYKSDNPYDQHIAFVKAIMQGSAAPVPADIGLYDIRIVKAVYKSACENRFVSVSEI